MSSIERRVEPRVNVRVPLRFRILNGHESVEQTAEAENISQRGIYFITAFPLNVGTSVEVSLQIPRELGGQTSSNVKCVARVVRINDNSALSGKSGIGLHIERYEAGNFLSERWAS